MLKTGVDVLRVVALGAEAAQKLLAWAEGVDMPSPDDELAKLPDLVKNDVELARMKARAGVG